MKNDHKDVFFFSFFCKEQGYETVLRQEQAFLKVDR